MLPRGGSYIIAVIKSIVCFKTYTYRLQTSEKEKGTPGPTHVLSASQLNLHHCLLRKFVVYSQPPKHCQLHVVSLFLI